MLQRNFGKIISFFYEVVIKDKDNYDSDFNKAYIILDCFEQSDATQIIDSDTIRGIYLYFDRCNDVPRVNMENAVDVLKSYLPIEVMKENYTLIDSNYRDIWPDVWTFNATNTPLQYDYYTSYKLKSKEKELLPEWITVHLYTDSYGIVVEAAVVTDEPQTLDTDNRWNYDYLSKENAISTGQIASELYFDNEFNINYPRPTESIVLREGDVCAEVGWLKSALNKAMEKSMDVNCEFNSKTKDNVIEFQTRCDLIADGIVGKSTINELIYIISGKKEMPAKITATLAPRNIEPVQPVTEAPIIDNTPQPPIESFAQDFIINTNSNKYHYPSCSEVNRMNEENKSYYHGSSQDLDSQGYTPCGKCHPR